MDLHPCCVTWASLVPRQDSPSLTYSWKLLDDSLGFLVDGIELEQCACTLPAHRAGWDGGVTLLSSLPTDTEAERCGP